MSATDCAMGFAVGAASNGCCCCRCCCRCGGSSEVDSTLSGAGTETPFPRTAMQTKMTSQVLQRNHMICLKTSARRL